MAIGIDPSAEGRIEMKHILAIGTSGASSPPFAKCFVFDRDKGFSEDVCEVVMSADLRDGNGTVLDLVVKVVPFDTDVLCAWFVLVCFS